MAESRNEDGIEDSQESQEYQESRNTDSSESNNEETEAEESSDEEKQSEDEDDIKSYDSSDCDAPPPRKYDETLEGEMQKALHSDQYDMVIITYIYPERDPNNPNKTVNRNNWDNPNPRPGPAADNSGNRVSWTLRRRKNKLGRFIPRYSWNNYYNGQRKRATD